jgi:hypothetical protein
MIKKSFIATITILIILISLLVGVQFVGVVEGNDLVIRILQPGANIGWSYQGGPIYFYYEANKPLSWVAYSIDGGANVTVTSQGIMLPTLTNGPHGIKLYANGTEGQAASSMTYYFSIYDSPLEPSPTQTPSPISTTNPLTSSNTALASDSISNNLLLTAILSILGLITIILLVSIYKRRKLKQQVRK